jgi:hypothetical protein
MLCSEFIERVRERAGLTAEKAKEVVEGTLRTLAGSCGRTPRENPATPLSREWKSLFSHYKAPEEISGEENSANGENGSMKRALNGMPCSTPSSKGCRNGLGI